MRHIASCHDPDEFVSVIDDGRKVTFQSSMTICAMPASMRRGGRASCFKISEILASSCARMEKCPDRPCLQKKIPFGERTDILAFGIQHGNRRISVISHLFETLSERTASSRKDVMLFGTISFIIFINMTAAFEFQRHPFH